MNNMMKTFAMSSAAFLAAFSMTACGDDGGTTPATDTTTGTDTTTPPADTTTGEDTTTPPADTTTGTDTVGPTVYPCTPEERDTFDACADACPDNDNACVQTCIDGFSPACGNAFLAFVGCIQEAGCTQANFETCVSQNCADEFDQYFGPIEPPGDCDPTRADACEAGENCTYVGEGEVGCVPAGTVAIGDACGQAEGNCASGACLGTAEGGECVPFCNPANNQCPDGRPCNVRIQGSDYLHCGDAPDGCNVFTQDCAVATEGCYPINAAGDTSCAANTGKTEGQSCEALNDCAKGFICVGTQQAASCRAVCDLEGAQATCTSGTCSAVGFQGGIGACLPQ